MADAHLLGDAGRAFVRDGMMKNPGSFIGSFQELAQLDSPASRAVLPMV